MPDDQDQVEATRRNRDITGCVLTGDGEDFCLGGDYRSAGASSVGRPAFGRAALNPDIVSLGRDLYYNTRGANPAEAIEQSRFALAAALKAME